MKRIGVITFHSAENSGAVLQCVALQKALRKLGADPFIIDYRPSYIEDQYEVFINPFAKARKERSISRKIKSFMAYFLQDIRFSRKLSRKEKFTQFRENYYTCSDLYKNYEELCANPPKADVYICGSDQIWNKNLTGGEYDPAYFLNFGNDNISKYSYAVSIGRELEECEYSQISSMTERFEKVSFREPSLFNKFLTRFPEEKYCTCVDPTLLLNKEDWMEFVEINDESEPYILVYALEKNQLLADLVTKVSKWLGVKRIIDISQCNIELKGNVKHKADISPVDFLTFINDAEFVITNSFHCTVFSLIFKKSFYTIPHSKSESRMKDLLSDLDMHSRLISAVPELCHPDYSNLDTIMRTYIKGSVAYLKNLV